MSDASKSARFNVKGFTSFVLAVAFLVLAVSGVVLFIGPRGRAAHAIGWTLLGLDRGQWNHVHMSGALLFLVASVFHLVWNWGMFWGYLKKKAAGLNLKLELAVALLIGVVLVCGTILDAPPFSSFFELKRTINGCWAASADETTPGDGHGRGQGHGGGQGRGQGRGRQFRGGR